MAYSTDLKKSANRHFEAAELLHAAPPPRGRPDVAGYLYGVAAECALKEIMRDSGMRPLPDDQRRDDPFYAHFPQLKTLLRDTNQGRRAGQLSTYAKNDALMSEWSTDMRYAPGKDVKPQNVQRWQEQAKQLLGAMEG